MYLFIVIWFLFFLSPCIIEKIGESPQNTFLQHARITHMSETIGIVKSIVWHACLKGKFIQLIWQLKDDM